MTMRTIGIELEVGRLQPEAARSALASSGVNARAEDWVRHNNRSYPAGVWKAVYDGSSGVASETVSPKLTENDYDSLRQVCQTLKTAGATINSGCGGHIHIDATDLTKNDICRLLGLWYASEHSIFGLVAQSRRENGYCQRMMTQLDAEGRSPSEVARKLRRFGSVSAIYQHIAKDNDYGETVRFKAMNLDAYLNHNAIEFRLHQGSLNASKLLHFARLLSAMVDYAKSDLPLPATKFARTSKMIDFYLPATTTAQEDGMETAIKLPAEGTKARIAFDIFIDGEAAGLSSTEMYDRCEAAGMPRHSARRWRNAYRKATRATTSTATDTAANLATSTYLKRRVYAL